jgi:hypothetical protein
VRCVFVLRPFSTNKVTTKNRLFRNPKGTPYSPHCFFKLCKRVDQQQESWRAQLEFLLSNTKNRQELTEKLRLHSSSVLPKVFSTNSPNRLKTLSVLPKHFLFWQAKPFFKSVLEVFCRKTLVCFAIRLTIVITFVRTLLLCK